LKNPFEDTDGLGAIGKLKGVLGVAIKEAMLFAQEAMVAESTLQAVVEMPTAFKLSPKEGELPAEAEQIQALMVSARLLMLQKFVSRGLQICEEKMANDQTLMKLYDHFVTTIQEVPLEKTVKIDFTPPKLATTVPEGCPIDALVTPAKEMCTEETEMGFQCTRPPNHKGQHHAHNTNGECVKIWETLK